MGRDATSPRLGADCGEAALDLDCAGHRQSTGVVVVAALWLMAQGSSGMILVGKDRPSFERPTKVESYGEQTRCNTASRSAPRK